MFKQGFPVSSRDFKLEDRIFLSRLKCAMLRAWHKFVSSVEAPACAAEFSVLHRNYLRDRLDDFRHARQAGVGEFIQQVHSAGSFDFSLMDRLFLLTSMLRVWQKFVSSINAPVSAAAFNPETVGEAVEGRKSLAVFKAM